MDELKAGAGKIVKEEAIWREDCENVLMSMAKRIEALEAAVISQQRIMESIAEDLLAPKSRIIRAS